jgi:hypothetical protein
MALVDAYLLLIQIVRELEAAEKKVEKPQPQPAPTDTPSDEPEQETSKTDE